MKEGDVLRKISVTEAPSAHSAPNFENGRLATETALGTSE